MSLRDDIKNVGALVEERGAVYGHPLDDFHRVSLMAELLKDCPDAVLRHVLYMMCVKICRLITTPHHEDSWLDIVGYAMTAAMVLEAYEGGPDAGSD